MTTIISTTKLNAFPFPYSRKTIAKARKIAKADFGVNSLFTGTSSNPKTAKNGKIVNVLTAPLHLAPGNLSGFQVCPMASPACLELCLHTAGNPIYMPGKERARINRTRLYFEYREVFLVLLYAELTLHRRRAQQQDMDCAFRPNATSDIAWEKVRFPNGQTVFELFPDIFGYDYTKILKRMLAFLDGRFPSNYYLTFSATEDNWQDCKMVLDAGGTVAMAFNRNPADILSYEGYPVINADRHDYRPDDPRGCIAGLKAKGKAKHDTSGFVRIV